MKHPKHIEHAIDLESPYAKKYLELVSKPSTSKFTEDHHIVPVAYFADVMGISECRSANSPVYRCARPCIRAQMANAVSLMFSLNDLNIRLSELTDMQAKEIANARDEVKAFTGWKTVRVHGGFIGKYLYDEGKPVYSFLLKPNGKVRKYVDHLNCFGTDEYNGQVHMWATDATDGDCFIACTSGSKWNRRKFEYEDTGVPVSYELTDITKNIKSMATGVLSFRRIIEKFYPRFKKNFDDLWDRELDKYKRLFPKLASAEIPDIPKNGTA